MNFDCQADVFQFSHHSAILVLQECDAGEAW